MSTDASVHEAIRQLVDEEHMLRKDHKSGARASEAKVQRLQELEVELDRCWDLLRQRRALRSAGGNPDRATTRSANQVGHYLQ